MLVTYAIPVPVCSKWVGNPRGDWCRSPFLSQRNHWYSINFTSATCDCRLRWKVIISTAPIPSLVIMKIHLQGTEDQGTSILSPAKFVDVGAWYSTGNQLQDGGSIGKFEYRPLPGFAVSFFLSLPLPARLPPPLACSPVHRYPNQRASRNKPSIFLFLSAPCSVQPIC